MEHHIPLEKALIEELNSIRSHLCDMVYIKVGGVFYRTTRDAAIESLRGRRL